MVYYDFQTVLRGTEMRADAEEEELEASKVFPQKESKKKEKKKKKQKKK
jgi:hypothetical protein